MAEDQPRPPARNPRSMVDYDDPETRRVLALSPAELLADPEAQALVLEIADEEGLS